MNKSIGEELAEELLGGIKYGDHRDNPKWRKRVVLAAGNLIQSKISQANNEEKVEKKPFGDTDAGGMLGCAAIIVAIGLFFFLIGWASSLNN